MSAPREMIEARCQREGLTIHGWAEGDDGVTASLGRYVVVSDEYADDGLYSGDEGVLSACVAGAEKYANQRVVFTLTMDEYDEGNEVRDLHVLDATDG